MPRKFLFTREQIVDAALEITRERGISAVTARVLGERLGASSKPIFSQFKSMDEVLGAVREAAEARYQSTLAAAMERAEELPYKASGMAYIRFAKEEKQLFRLLFMRDRSQESDKENPEEMDALIALICNQVDIDKRGAELFYIEMWTYTHGIASMVATNYFDWNEEFVSRILTDGYEGLKHRFTENAK